MFPETVKATCFAHYEKQTKFHVPHLVRYGPLSIIRMTAKVGANLLMFHLELVLLEIFSWLCLVVTHTRIAFFAQGLHLRLTQ
jgi:hypothetical protein